ncbi:MAG TPA: hypothetical protein VI997_11545, partial [Candidatus Thermoplasmatota archaeon]|nr:hypothetical protein [Candidatus Thermoplasmatota archaeon]
MRLPPALVRAVAWTTARRRVILPVLFVVLVVANVVAFAILAPPFRSGVSVQVTPPGPGAGVEAPPPDVDTDGDGVPDLDELYLYGTDPTREDTDGDALPDAWEGKYRRYDPLSGDFTPDPVVEDGASDPDHDGATNLEEYLGGADPNDADTDDDDLPDGWEIRNGLDPTASNRGKDTDGDGASDSEEFARGTHPARLDSDLDGLPDAREIELGTDASRYSTSGSSVADGWLLAFGLDPKSPDVAYKDLDGDGMTVQDEFNWSARRFDFLKDLSEIEAAQNFRRGLDPTNPDTDADKAGDGWEVRFDLEPLAGGDGGEDLDGDGLSNLEEFAADSDPRRVDTDGDGLTDFDEARTGWKIRLEERDLTVFSDPSRRDSDGDGLTDPEERQGFAVRGGSRVDFCGAGPCGLNPKNPDTDLDGLADGSEILYEVSPRLDPLVADTDGDGLLDGAEVRFWEDRGKSLTAADAARLAEERADVLGARETPQAAREEVSPVGDVDGDGVPNVVDPDSDGDKLDDGLEVKPGLWRGSPGSDLRFPYPPSDPLFRDTDGDALRDSWEKEFARWDPDCGLWNLDGSRANSYLPCPSKNDGKTDADRDLDADGVRYESGAYRERRLHVFTNVLEQLAGTDPNDPDTDNDGIPDGWESFFTEAGRRLGVVVRLDPTDGTDANDTSKTLPYLRFAGTSVGSVEPLENESILDVFGDVGTPDGGSQTVVSLAGEEHVSYLSEFLAATDPTSADTDGDGLPDAWEFHFTKVGGFTASDSTNPFNPVLDTASKDPDQDTLTNLQEAEVLDPEGRAGLNPLQADTDLGGITDEKELGELGPEGPLDPRNDNLDLDADGDGLTNGEEAFKYRTSPSLADSDRDGLLDGGNVDLDLARPSDVTKSKRFEAAGVIGVHLSTTVWRYYGEGTLDDPDRTDPTKADTDADGLPDGWEAFYKLPARIYTAGATSDPDGLDDSQEYGLGKPLGWDARKTWWFGTDPTQRDTDADGGADGGFDRQGRQVGQDLDYDNDGVNDLTGEDPFPFYDHNDTGKVRTTDAATMRGWVVSGGRTRTHLLDKDGDRIPDVADQAVATFKGLQVSFPDSDGILPKGGALRITGQLVAETNDGDVPVPRAVVVANIDGVGGDASRVLGIAVTHTDGTFSLEAAARRDRWYEVPPGGNVTIFGVPRAAGQNVTWSLNTTLLQPKATDRRVVVWNYGASAVEGRMSFSKVPCSALTATFPIDCAGPFHAEGLRSSFDRPTDIGRPVKIKTATALELPSGGGVLRAGNGGNLTGTGRLVDAAGDGIPTRAVTVTWQGAGKAVTTAPDGTFPIAFAAGTFPAPGFYDISATFIGDGDRVYQSSTGTGRVAIAFDTRITASVRNPGLVVAAGTELVVEGNLTDYLGAPVGNATVVVRFLSGGVENRTEEDGSYRIVVPAPDDVLAGTQRVVAEFPGDDLHKASSIAQPIYVTVKQKTRFAAFGGDRPITEPLVIEGSLLDAANQSVRDPTSREKLKVRIVGPDFVTESDLNENGVFTTALDSASLPTVGLYPVRLTFVGSPLYAPATTVVEYRLVSTSSFVLSEQRVPRGIDSAVTGRLVDGRGDGIHAGSVDIVFGDLTLGSFLTNETGGFEAPMRLPPASALGPVKVRVTYNGTSDGLYAAATPGVATYHVVARTRLILPDRDVPTGEFVLNGSLIDDGGSAVGGEEVRITLEGIDVGRARTDFEGGFEVVVNPACLGVAAGGACPGGSVLARTYTARAAFPGSLVYAPADARSTIRVLARTDIIVDELGTVARGQDLEVRGRLIQEDGHGVPRAPIVVTLGGKDRNVTIGRALTLPNGSFVVDGPVPSTFARGPAPLRVSYAGDANRRASEEVVIVDVVAPTHLQLKLPNRLDVGDSFTGTVILVDDEGKPVPNAIIRVRFSGYPYPFTLKTNETGETSFPGKIVEAGQSEVAVRFAGGGPLLGATE